MKKFALLSVVILLPVIAAAQGSGSVSPAGAGGSSGSGGFDDSAFLVTKTAKFKVLSVPGDGTLAVSDEAGTKRILKIDKKARIKADKGTELASLKTITLADFEPGMVLRVVYRSSDLVAIELRILKTAKA